MAPIAAGIAEACRRTRSHMAVLTLVAFVLASGRNPALASSTRIEHPDYLIEQWLAADGIPENSALAIAQTADGYLWIGSTGGLLRFNGRDFLPAADLYQEERLGGVIVSLHADRSGRLWAGTDRDLAVLEKNQWRFLPTPRTIVRTIAEDPGGPIFVGTLDGKMLQIHPDRMQTLDVPQGIVASGMFCYRDEQDDGIWLANRGFIGRRLNNGWVRMGPPASDSGAIVAGPARGGGLWVYGRSSLCRYNPGVPPQSFPAPWIEDPRQLLEDRHGWIWIASNQGGLIRLGLDGSSLSIAAGSRLAHNSARSILEDAEGNLWLGTSSGGLYRLRPRQFLSLDHEAGLPNPIIRTVTEELPGRILVGTHGGGIARIEKEHAVLSGSAGRISDALYAWSVHRDRKGKVWVGTYGRGLLVEEKGGLQPFPLPEELGLAVYSILEDSRDRLWIGTVAGLGIIEGGSARVVTRDPMLRQSGVRCLGEDPRSGVFWIGTFNHGLFRLAGADSGRADAVAGLPGSRISSLRVNEDGSLWIGVFGHGLAWYRDGKISLIGPDQGLKAETIGAILKDEVGNYWLGSNRGICRVSSQELDQVAYGSLPRAHFHVFDRNDGLLSRECSEGYQPTAVRDSQGRFWLGTTRGVVRFDPSRLRLNTRVPPVVVERIRFRNSGGTFQTVELPGPRVRLPSGSSELTVFVAALSLAAPEKNQYAFRLHSPDRPWVELGGQNEIYFHHLDPGSLDLQVKAANNDGFWNEAGVALDVYVEPYFWQTGWFLNSFRILTAAGIAGLAIGFTRRRLIRRIEKLEHQQVLEEERSRLATVLEATSDLVVFAEADGRIIYINPAGRRLIGQSGEESISDRQMTDIYTPSAAQALAREGIPTAIRDGTWANETTVLHRSGEARDVSQVIAAHKNSEGQVLFFSAIARDITESKRFQEQLRQAQKMDAIGQLAGGVAHDFNNILTVILGRASLLENSRILPAELRPSVADIGKSAERAASLTRQLLTFSRRQTLQWKELNLNDVVSDMTRMLNRILGEDIQLHLHYASQRAFVRADEGMLEQVLLNLAVNSRDAMPQGGQMIIETSCLDLDAAAARQIPQAMEGSFVCLSVRDTGCGIAPEIIPRIFEPFFTTKDVGRGTGLGLAIVYGIVEQHKGWIQVISQQGEGTAFRIYIPRLAQPALQDAELPTAVPLRGGSETILLVEDEPELRILAGSILEDLGYRVLEAANGVMALSLWRDHRSQIHLLFTDLVMPGGVNGVELARRLREENPDLKVIYTSGYGTGLNGDPAFLRDGASILAKPFSQHDLAQMVRAVLDEETPPGP